MKKEQWPLAILLAALGMVSPFSIDTFFPSFRAMSAEFQLTDWQIQQTLTIYLLPFAIAALVHGPLSDAFGRRPVVLIGLALYTLASIACALAPSFAVLMIFRAVQGMTAGTGLIVGRAIVRDILDGPAAQRLMAAISMIFGVAPAIAPVIGGWIHVSLGWRSVFGFMVLIGLALVAATAMQLPETHPRERRVPFDVRRLAATAWCIATDRRFLLLALASSINFAALIAFVGAAPAIVLDHWHLNETQFAYLFVPLILGFVLGAASSGRLAGRIPRDTQVKAGFAITLGGLALMALTEAVLQAPPRLLQQGLLMLSGFGVQLVFPVLSLQMLDLFPKTRGSAASVQSFFSLTIMTIFIGLIAPLLSDSMLKLALGVLAGTLLAYMLWRLAPRAPHEHEPPPE